MDLASFCQESGNNNGLPGLFEVVPGSSIPQVFCTGFLMRHKVFCVERFNIVCSLLSKKLSLTPSKMRKPKSNYRVGTIIQNIPNEKNFFVPNCLFTIDFIL